MAVCTTETAISWRIRGERWWFEYECRPSEGAQGSGKALSRRWSSDSDAKHLSHGEHPGISQEMATFTNVPLSDTSKRELVQTEDLPSILEEAREALHCNWCYEHCHRWLFSSCGTS
ncbi:hypothetical protein BAUCODRAFT_313007 [Baudoinia panamericana UAMH 10762]|uniref:Uncharacterized protein n=1 Tax=Baudoinia panamericana (strain UAMH 10762) TaxID=717646 RepID=M2MZ99_BAUPA|nr:uncharacterized protein BAUCODRAFT_313007 [Baudoinia panamericana UAMH 10762]EMC91989.1 hypothetical protein BAUCODRAFT_313007 [Baudoinia panamericana UAMH 10762]